MHSKFPYSSSVTGAVCEPEAWSRSSTAFFRRTISGSFIQPPLSSAFTVNKRKSKANPNQDGRANRNHRRLANFIAVVEQILSCHEEIDSSWHGHTCRPRRAVHGWTGLTFDQYCLLLDV